MKKLLAVLVTVMVVGCSSDNTDPINEGAPDPGGGSVVKVPGDDPAGGDAIGGGGDAVTPPTTEVGGLAEPLAAQLRLKGVDLDAYRSVLAQVKSVRVSVDGAELPVVASDGYFELTQPGHAWLLGRFELPKGAKQVRVELAFDDFGGYESATEAGAIDFRAPPIRFEAPAEYFLRNQHAVVHFDVAKSLIAWHAQKLALPSFQVQF